MIWMVAMLRRQCTYGLFAPSAQRAGKLRGIAVTDTYGKRKVHFQKGTRTSQ